MIQGYYVLIRNAKGEVIRRRKFKSMVKASKFVENNRQKGRTTEIYVINTQLIWRIEYHVN